jgi:hypothetical protein
MYKIATLCLIVLTSSFALMSRGSTNRSECEESHCKWIETSLTEMQTIKVGMTRADLLKVFMEEGGLSTRTMRTYVYRGCPYLKVNFEFKPVGEVKAFNESPSDKIIKISQPFLQWGVED